MANSKNKVNTHKKESTKSNGKGKVGRPKKSLINVNNKKKKPVQAMKNPRTSKLGNKKVQNQDLQFGKLSDEYLNDKLLNNIKSKSEYYISRKRNVLKNGHIKHKNKYDLKLYNNILKSELLIEESSDINLTEKYSGLNSEHLIKESSDVNLTEKDSGLNSELLIEETSDINFTEKDSGLNSGLLIEESSDINLTGKDSGLNNNNTILADQNKDENTTISIFITRDLFKKDIKKNKSKKSKRKEKGKRNRQKKVSSKPLPQNSIFECDHCQRKFLSKSSLRRHIYIHLDFTNYTCTQCNKSFRKQLYLSAHVKRQHPNWAEHFMCTMCDKPFLLKENLKNHLLSHTRTESMFKCIYCKEQYLDQKELINHEKEHLIDGMYQCIICEMSFDCRNRLSSHYKTHLRVKDYICQHCGKEFLRINSMRRHVQICHSGVRIQCPICKKDLKGHLTEHMRTHDKARPHICPDCGQRFTQSTQLNVHRRSHTGARPYPCRICGRAFSHSNALMLHIRRHTGEKPFVCAMCPLSFSQLPHMKAHMKNIHGKINPYKCQKCKQFFKLKVDIENHMKGCTVGDKELSFEEKIQASVQIEEIEVESVMSLPRMRFLLALLLTMIGTKEKLKYLGFNKRLIDDILTESLEAMGHKPCKDESLTPYLRLKSNIEILLNGTVPKEKMANFRKENKSIEELLELLTNEKKNN